VTLESLLDRAGVDRRQRFQWFSHCALKGTTLLVSDIDDYSCIERCWLTRLREVSPVQMVFVTEPQFEQAIAPPRLGG
jgi:hypothetical protein